MNINPLNNQSENTISSEISSIESEATVAENRFKKTLYVLLFSFITLLTLLPLGAHADKNALQSLFNAPKSKFLKVDEAFQTIAVQKGNTLSVNFVVTPKHYVYKDRIKVTTAKGQLIKPIKFNIKADSVIDPEFGKVDVFQKNVTISLKLPKSIAVGETLKLRWQGCAKAGLCYPPVTESITVKKKH